MPQVLSAFAPILAFMLIPMWIPLIAVAAGRLGEVVVPRRQHSVAERIAALQQARRGVRAVPEGGAS